MMTKAILTLLAFLPALAAAAGELIKTPFGKLDQLESTLGSTRPWSDGP